MSDFSTKKEATPLPSAPTKIAKHLELHAPPPPVSFENKALKTKLGALFPQVGLQGFALVVKKEDLQASQALLTAIRSKLAPCDLLILEEMEPIREGSYKAIFGTERTLANLAVSIQKVPYPEWSVLSANKEAKITLWNTLSEICRSPS